jgi:hypothetical protein
MKTGPNVMIFGPTIKTMGYPMSPDAEQAVRDVGEYAVRASHGPGNAAPAVASDR